MQFARVANNKVVEYPYSIPKLKRDLYQEGLRISFPKNASPEAFEPYGLVQVTPQEVSNDPSYQEVQYAQTPELVEGSWVLPATVIDMPLELRKHRMKEQLRELHESRAGKEVIFNGMPVPTNDRSISRMLGGKANAKAGRKLLLKNGGRAVMTSAQLSAMADAVDDYVQAVMDRAYDLAEAIDNATDHAGLSAIDLNSGWPSNRVTQA